MKIIHTTHIEKNLPSLTALLVSCVTEDSSIGFIPPLSTASADVFWLSQSTAIINKEKILFIAVEDEDIDIAEQCHDSGQSHILGVVILAMVQQENGKHRAEVEKLMVAPDARGQGIAQALMCTLEHYAQTRQRHLLVLDTRKGDPASQLYKKLGYIQGGEIPAFAANAQGKLESTVYFYKLLPK